MGHPDRGWSSKIERLSSMHEALSSSILSTTKQRGMKSSYCEQRFAVPGIIPAFVSEMDNSLAILTFGFLKHCPRLPLNPRPSHPSCPPPPLPVLDFICPRVGMNLQRNCQLWHSLQLQTQVPKLLPTAVSLSLHDLLNCIA